MKERILIVEDDKELSEFIQGFLASRGYRVAAVETAEKGLGAVQRQAPDLIISDLQLPGLSGLKLCELLRQETRTSSIPVILLTVRGSESDKVRGLQGGADDYMTKPFSTKELAARVEALLRRSRGGGKVSPVLRAGDLQVDTDRCEVLARGEKVALRRMEFELLVLLLKSRGRVLTKNYIRDALWKDETIVASNTINVHVRNLRNKLGPCRGLIETVIGRGYRIAEDA